MTCTFSAWAAGSAAGASAHAQYLAAATLDHARAEYYGQPQLRSDLSPELAARLGIDQTQALDVEAISRLFNLQRADNGGDIGKRIKAPMKSLVELFGLDHTGRKPEGVELENVLAGRRVDGTPIDHPPMQRLHAALALRADYETKIHATNPPVGGVDLTFSPDKSLSVAYALGTEAERVTVLDIHQRAVADTMAYVEREIGSVRRGDGGKGGTEPGKLAAVEFTHFTARPVTDRDEQQVPDPQLHTHVAVINAVYANGRIGSLDLDLLKGRVHEFGAVYHGRIAHHAGQAGIRTELGPHGEARFSAIPEVARQLFSKRTQEAERAGRRLAEGLKGEDGRPLDWDKLSPEQKAGLNKAGSDITRKPKPERNFTDFDEWRMQAREHGYQHKLGRQHGPIRSHGPELAYSKSLDLLEESFSKSATVTEASLRIAAARGFVAAGGIGANPAQDIDVMLEMFKTHGIRQDGERTQLEFGQSVPVRGKSHTVATTALHVDREKELIELAQEARQDRSHSLTELQLDRAAAAFLARRPEIDPEGAQWKAQREMIDGLGMGGRFGVAIGVAGSGKSTAMEVLVDAWKAGGRQVFGAALANRTHARDLAKAGVAESDRAAIDTFIKRAKDGKYPLDSRSVVLVDEVSMIGTRQQLEMLRLQKKHGFALVEVGDFEQLRSVEAGGGLKLLQQALPGAIPEITTSIRQRDEREREIAKAFRDGQADVAVQMKREDQTAILVPGGRTATAEKVAQLWQESGGKATISTATNANAHQIGEAIRHLRQNSGELGPDQVERHGIALAVGDRVRLFDRVHDAEDGRRVLGNNGDVVTINELHQRYMKVENEKGEVGTVLWSKTKNGLDYGYAGTAHLAQGVTNKQHIHALLDGTRTSNAQSAYVGMSRHTDQALLVVNESAVRRDIARKQVRGVYQPITEETVWNKVATDLSRKPETTGALELMSRVTASHDAGASHQPQQQQSQFREHQWVQAVKMHFHAMHEHVRTYIDQMRDMVREQAQRQTHEQPSQRHEHQRGPSLGFGR